MIRQNVIYDQGGGFRVYMNNQLILPAYIFETFVNPIVLIENEFGKT